MGSLPKRETDPSGKPNQMGYLPKWEAWLSHNFQHLEYITKHKTDSVVAIVLRLSIHSFVFSQDIVPFKVEACVAWEASNSNRSNGSKGQQKDRKPKVRLQKETFRAPYIIVVSVISVMNWCFHFNYHLHHNEQRNIGVFFFHCFSNVKYLFPLSFLDTQSNRLITWILGTSSILVFCELMVAPKVRPLRIRIIKSGRISKGMLRRYLKIMEVIFNVGQNFMRGQVLKMMFTNWHVWRSHYSL